jgi:hypothetical protein
VSGVTDLQRQWENVARAVFRSDLRPDRTPERYSRDKCGIIEALPGVRCSKSPNCCSTGLARLRMIVVNGKDPSTARALTVRCNDRRLSSVQCWLLPQFHTQHRARLSAITSWGAARCALRVYACWARHPSRHNMTVFHMFQNRR